MSLLGDRLQIFLLISTEIIRGYLICLNSLNIRTQIWRQFLSKYAASKTTF